MSLYIIKNSLIEKLKLTNDYLDTIIELTKQRLGIMSDVKKSSIELRVFSAIQEIAEQKNLVIDINDANHLSILVDIACWRYSSVTRISRYDGSSNPSMPADLRYRLNNYLINGEQRKDDI